MKSKRIYFLTIVLLSAFLVVLAGYYFKLWAEKREIEARSSLPPVIFQQASIGGAPIFGGATPRTSVLENKEALSKEKKDFVFVDLNEMKIALYKGGEPVNFFSVLRRGEGQSFFDVRDGTYAVLSKESNRFSSINRTWLPWSIQFSGNFFIHGISDIREVEGKEGKTSGLALKNEDAKEVYQFVARNTPVLVSEIEKPVYVKPMLVPFETEIGAPQISAKAALIIDLDTEEVILDSNADEVMPMASLVKLMTAAVASDLLYLGKTVEIKKEMLSDRIQSYQFEIGNRYRVLDLLYPMLMESSNGAAKTLAVLLGTGEFVEQMNKKALSLGMNNTVFQDASGVQDENVTSLKDLSRLAKYILDEKRFIFDITKGKSYDNYQGNNFSQIENFNEFYNDDNLIGMKNGKTTKAGETLLGVWRFKDRMGIARNIMIGVLGSERRAEDTEILLRWLDKFFVKDN